MILRQLKSENYYNPRRLTTPSSPPPLEPLSPGNCSVHESQPHGNGFKLDPVSGSTISSSNRSSPCGQRSSSSMQTELHGKGKRGRPRKHAIKIPLPPLYVFIRNLLHNRHYNPRVIIWVSYLLT